MLKVLFFAQLREQLQCDSLILEAAPDNLLQLREQLSEKSTLWRELLDAKTTLAAVNQTISDDSALLKDGDEVAFFPPVTGG